jgi:hypothetical protein
VGNAVSRRSDVLPVRLPAPVHVPPTPARLHARV